MFLEIIKYILTIGIIGYIIKIAFMGLAFLIGAIFWVIGVIIWASNALGRMCFKK